MPISPVAFQPSSSSAPKVRALKGEALPDNEEAYGVRWSLDSSRTGTDDDDNVEQVDEEPMDDADDATADSKDDDDVAKVRSYVPPRLVALAS